MEWPILGRFQKVWACRAGSGRCRVRARLTGSRLLVAAWCLLVPGSALAEEFTYIVRDTADPCLNVRVEASTEAEQIDCLAPGTTVTHLEVVPYWRKIRLADGREGWAAKKFLDLASAPPPASAPASIPTDAFLEVHFIDVGQGDAIWIHTHDDGIDGNGIFEGKNIVIDGGPYSSDTTNRCLPYLESRGHHGAGSGTRVGEWKSASGESAQYCQRVTRSRFGDAASQGCGRGGSGRSGGWSDAGHEAEGRVSKSEGLPSNFYDEWEDTLWLG